MAKKTTTITVYASDRDKLVKTKKWLRKNGRLATMAEALHEALKEEGKK